MAESLDARFKRLLLMVPFVIKHPGIPVKELCRKFDIGKSQLIADINLLFVCGLPGYGPGDLIEAYVDGGQVFIRMADYFSRPLRLSYAEGLLLYCGARALAEAGAGDDALDRVMKRLEEVLGEDALARVAIRLEAPAALSSIRTALEEQRRLHIVYWSQSSDATTERDVDPWALFASEGRWYLVGWCHRVKDERIFRADRVKAIQVLDLPAQIPADVDLSKYEDLYVKGAGAAKVVLEVAPQAAGWLSEYYPLESRETVDGGWIRLTLTAGGMAWLEKLLLRLGRQARVVEPVALADSVKKLACELARRYR